MHPDLTFLLLVVGRELVSSCRGMKTIAHLSDLRFGAENPRVLHALSADLKALAPSLLVVCGDVTHRAGARQFTSAQAFLDAIPCKRLLVPGDRDVPLFNPFRRFFAPFARYQKLISASLTPYHQDEEMTVYGLNTARGLAWDRGRISFDQVNSITTRICPTPGGRYRVLVTHHPFIPPPDQPKGGIDYSGRWRHVVSVLDSSLVDLCLAGHLASDRTSYARAFQTDASFVMAQAGSASARLSNGRRNAYNVLTLGEDRIDIRTRVYDGSLFADSAAARYWLDDGDWVKAA